METLISPSDFDAMQLNEPYKVYKKVILGKVYVRFIDPFTGLPAETGIIMQGDPSKDGDACLFRVWNKMQDEYFKHANKILLDNGSMIELKEKKAKKKGDKNPNSLQDEELDAVLNNRWYAFKAALNNMTAEAPLYRLLTMAEEQDKSEKTIEAIKARLSEIQYVE